MRRVSIVVCVVLTACVAAAGPAKADGSSPGTRFVSGIDNSNSVQSTRVAQSGSAPAAPAKPQGHAGSGSSAPSASQKTSAVPTLPTVVVTATRIRQPLSEIGTTVSVVDKQQIQSQKIEEIGSVLRQVPGLQVTQSGSPGTITDVSIRGATPAQTLVMMDGVEVNSGSTGSFDLSNVTTDNLSHVEVVRGAGGALYGSQAIGGVINLITGPGKGPPKASLLSEGGNRATERQVMTLSGAGGAFGYAGALSYFSTTGFRPSNDSFDDLSGALRLDYQATGDTALRGFARYIRSNVSLVNLTNFIPALDPNAHQRDEFMLYKGEVDHRFDAHLKTNVSAYFVRDEVRLNALPFPADPVFEIDRLPDEIRGTTWEAEYAWIPGVRTLIGFDFKDRWTRVLDEFNGFGFASVTQFTARRQEYAGYVEQEVSLFDGLVNATAGFRVDGNSDFGREVSPSWAVAMPLVRYGLTLRGSYSEGFRAPGFNELFFPFFGNPGLSPEISSEYDGGVTKTFGEYASFTVTYFSRRVHSLIVAVPCSTCLFGVQAGNAGRVDVQGIEFVPMVELMPGLKLSGNFTWIDETHSSSSPAIRPVRVPKRAAFGLLQYLSHGLYLAADQLTLSLAYTFVGDRDDIDSVTSTIRNNVGYHRFDLVASYAGGVRWNRVSNEEAFVRVQNLFDRQYSEVLGFKSAPVNFVAGIKVDFQ